VRMVFRRIDSFPQLAWCVRLRRGAADATVLHGCGVEVRQDAFFEGAWDGPFEAGRFDEAMTFVGSGARATPQAMIFATPTHLTENVYSIQVRDEMFVSNSIACVLVQAGEDLDRSYRDYFFDVLEDYRAGISRPFKSIRTRGGKPVSFHSCANIVVTTDLLARRVEKRVPQPPHDFASYVGHLESTLGRLFENAAHPSRLRRYRPVATVSAGYDSPAVAVLAMRRGCSEAMTLVGVDPVTGAVDDRDSGRRIGERLGLRVTEYDRLAYRRLPDLPEAEFCASSPAGPDVVMAAAEQQLAGALLLTGRHAEPIWTRQRYKFLPEYRNPFARRPYGASLAEFRLRVGAQVLPAPFVGAWNGLAVLRISNSVEMRPWCVGGTYDRPIPRRIVEEAGIPRAWFGQEKYLSATDLPFVRVEATHPSMADFIRFSASCEPPTLLQRGAFGVMRRLYLANRRLNASIERAYERAGTEKELPTVVSERYRPRAPELARVFAYSFQWGARRIASRYEIPASQRELKVADAG
jgi:hypothetical protein